MPIQRLCLLAGRCVAHASPLAVLVSLSLLVAGCPRGGGLPAPNPPAALTPANCGIANLPAVPPGAGPLALNAAANNGGTYTGSTGVVANQIQLVETGQDLVIVVDGDLDINADILFPTAVQTQGLASLNITLVSVNGTLTIAQGVTIGGGQASASARGNPGANGQNGGTVTLIGVNIDVQGQVIGNQGGPGAGSTLTGQATPTAQSANGGAGGQVLFCSLESINFGGAGIQAIGGKGGLGGNASATGSGATNSNAGSGGPGGNVNFFGTGPGGAQVQIFLAQASRVAGGKGGTGGVSIADANGGTSGSNATSTSGAGGTGGTVLFTQSIVMTLGAIEAGDGGNGATSTALGGNRGNSILFAGGNGGNATSTGGNGGAVGTVPAIPTPNGVVPGAAGTPGPGGRANATAGNGGNAGRLSNSGGSSGSATATGGPNGAGAAAGATPATGGPVAAAGGAGATTPPVTQLGAP